MAFNYQDISEVTGNPILDLIRKLPHLSMARGPWVAGGSVRRIVEGRDSLGASDIDIFFADRDQWGMALNHMIANLDPVITNQTRFSVTCEVWMDGCRASVQLIHKEFFPTVEALLDDFDFTVSMFATDGETLAWDERALGDLDARKLVWHRDTRFAPASRLLKYTLNGFTPEPGGLSRCLGPILGGLNEHLVHDINAY